MPPQLHSLYLLDTAVACYLHFQVNYNSFQPQFRIFSLPVKYTDWKPSCRHYVQPHTSLSHHMLPQSALHKFNYGNQRFPVLLICRCYIHIIKFNRDINVIIRLLFQLGQKNYRLHMHTKLKHISTKPQKYERYLYSTNTARASSFTQNISSLNFAPP